MLATVEGSNASAAISYIHTDHLTGSAVATDSAGAQTQLLDYHPWGTIRLNNQSSTFNEKRKFAGHEYDTESGLSYMQSRYYEPATGRFLSEDPAFVAIGDRGTFESRFQRSLEQHLQNPQALNSYSYGLNNPLTFRDPQGEVVPLIILGAWAAVEFGLSAYDAYSTFQTIQSSDAGSVEKAVTLGGFAAGLALPGGGYGAAGKQAAKHVDEVVDAVKAGKAAEQGQNGWKVGEPFTNNTAKGNVPAWSTVRQRYWKNEALTEKESVQNLERMQKGLAPKVFDKGTGKWSSMELHHDPSQREGDLFNFKQVTPSEHAKADPFRRTKK